MEYKLEGEFRSLEGVVLLGEIRRADSVVLNYLREIGLREACDYVNENDSILPGCENFDLGLKAVYVKGEGREAIFLQRGNLEIKVEREELGIRVQIKEKLLGIIACRNYGLPEDSVDIVKRLLDLK
ncbi:hypothetical protein J4405_01690 [Candidatus Woesearchaeota archaeon]|nr:hypothetical protein [Candidatus Woesearchaeota archaeon]